nr:MAG TPA: hypothetical protein [Caudoviricetes sp.]
MVNQNTTFVKEENVVNLTRTIVCTILYIIIYVPVWMLVRKIADKITHRKEE